MFAITFSLSAVLTFGILHCLPPTSQGVVENAEVSASKPATERPNYQNEDYSHDDDRLKLAGPGAIIEKKDWGGRPAVNVTEPLKHPVNFVIISHSGSPPCDNFRACCLRVQAIQTFHVSLRSPDIGYNFLIGGDGNAYVGRGWDDKNFHRGDSIGIDFIGNFVYDYLTEGMISMAKKLLEIGVEKGKLASNYTLLAHNQTWGTNSPGVHVYEVIKTWPHFDPRTYY